MVPPGLSSPSASAASIILTAMRSLALPPGLRYSILAATVPAPSGTTEFSCTRGVLPMSSLTCRAMRMSPSCQARTALARPVPNCFPRPQGLPGGLSDVVADLAQRSRGLGNRGRGELEDVHLAGPDT